MLPAYDTPVVPVQTTLEKAGESAGGGVGGVPQLAHSPGIGYGAEQRVVVVGYARGVVRFSQR
jgi:hypothetical protein